MSSHYREVVSVPVLDFLLEFIAGVSASICMKSDLCWFVTMAQAIRAPIVPRTFPALFNLCICWAFVFLSCIVMGLLPVQELICLLQDYATVGVSTSLLDQQGARIRKLTRLRSVIFRRANMNSNVHDSTTHTKPHVLSAKHMHDSIVTILSRPLGMPRRSNTVDSVQSHPGSCITRIRPTSDLLQHSEKHDHTVHAAAAFLGNIPPT